MGWQRTYKRFLDFNETIDVGDKCSCQNGDNYENIIPNILVPDVDVPEHIVKNIFVTNIRILQHHHYRNQKWYCVAILPPLATKVIFHSFVAILDKVGCDNARYCDQQGCRLRGRTPAGRCNLALCHQHLNENVTMK